MKPSRARSESSASVVSPAPSKNEPAAPAEAFPAQEAPTRPTSPSAPVFELPPPEHRWSAKAEGTGKVTWIATDFEAQARVAFDTEGPLPAEDEARIDAARARVLAFAKDQALLDWLDEPEPEPIWKHTAGDVSWSFREGGDADANVAREGQLPDQAPAPLVPVTGGALASLALEAEQHAKHSKAKRTTVEYDKQWDAFCAWCAQHGRVALPADAQTLALYVTDRARTVGASTLGQALSAITHHHDKHRVPSPRHDPVFKEVFSGIVREKGRAKKKKDALTLAKLERIVPILSGETAIRDRALLLVGYSAGLRRNELVSTLVEHYARDDLGRGYVLTLPRSKTDQRGEGKLKAIPVNRRSRLMSPADALDDWLAVSGIDSGFVFRGIQNFKITAEPFWGEDVARVVKRWAKRAGIENWENLSGHSLRAGFITDARRQKQSWASITKQTGQTEKTAEGYVRQEEIWEDNAAVELFR